jgi:hypothetical protein
MTTVRNTISEHDVVVLRETVGRWAAGTSSAVISVYDGAVLLEIVGSGGETLGVMTVPAHRLDVRKA